MHRLLALAVALSIAPACISTRTVGVTELPLMDPRPTPLACLNYKNGSTGYLTRGTVAGQPAVHIDFGVGIDFVMNERVEIEGGAAYAGESCIHDGALCDVFMVVETSTATYVVYHQTFSGAATVPPASGKVMVESMAGMIPRLKALDLDRNTRIAFAGLADARETSGWIRLAALVASAGAMSVGMHTGDAELAQGGLDAGISVVTADFSEAERPLLMSYPKLVKALKFGPMLCIDQAVPK